VFSRSDQVAIVGVGHSQIGRRLDRPLGLLAKDAVYAAIADAGLTVADIDGAATFPLYPVLGAGAGRDGHQYVSLSWMVRKGGLSKVRWWSETNYGNVSTAIEQAAMALAHRRCNYAVVWRAVSMPKAGGYQVNFDASEARGDGAFAFPYGLSGAPMGFALTYNRYLKQYGATREHLAALVLAQRRGANQNPNAHFRDIPLTYDDYVSARMVADPLGLLDCDIPVDGAGAVVVARVDRARNLRTPPAYIQGLGQAAFNSRAVSPNIATVGPDAFADCRVTTASMGKQLWESSGFSPSDIGAAMLYDGFAPDVYFWLEGLGFCAEGEAFEFIQDGRVERDGVLPVNTFGGNLSEGRLHGIGHWIEGALQVQGRAGPRQVREATNVVVATGLLGNGSGAVLSSASRSR
jgi:acetyl-CoA acetyltransferase